MLPASNPEYFWNNDPFTRLFNQNFGTGLLSHHFPSDMPTLPNSYWNGRSDHYRPRRPPPPPPRVPKEGNDAEGLWTSLNLNRDKFEVKLDVHQFLPEEITIQVQDKHIIIEGRHEEKEDPHGFISRNFQRRYLLPENVKMEHVICNLSSDGVLIITAPRVELEDENRFLPITQTGKPAMFRGHSGVHVNIDDGFKRERWHDLVLEPLGRIRGNANGDIHDGCKREPWHGPGFKPIGKPDLIRSNANVDIHDEVANGRCHTPHCEQNHRNCLNLGKGDSGEVKV